MVEVEKSAEALMPDDLALSVQPLVGNKDFVISALVVPFVVIVGLRR